MDKIEDWNLKLGSRIVNCCKHNGFLSAITKGERGYGKSIYNLKVMAYVYYNLLDYSESEAWKQALNSFIFTPSDLMKRIDYNIEHDVISPVWCIDDATVHFSSRLYFIDFYESNLIDAAFDTMRTVVSGILINCPAKHRLTSSLRHYDDYDISIYKERENYYDRKAVGIKWYSLPDGHRKYRKEFEDYFSCYVYQNIYDAYMIMRKAYLSEVNAELKARKALKDKIKEKIALPAQKP